MLKNRVKDFYFHKAKDAGYPARSIFKLKEADEKYKLLRNGQAVLDFGAFPGSWLKYVSGKVGSGGYVLGVDRQKLESLPDNAQFLERDVLALDPKDLTAARDEFDVVLSDLAPSTSGNKAVDHLRSIELARKALLLAAVLLKKGGAFFVKVFQGEDLPAFFGEVKTQFSTVKYFKPKSSRPESREIFILALNKKKK